MIITCVAPNIISLDVEFANFAFLGLDVERIEGVKGVG
jgi:hypothetical protein